MQELINLENKATSRVLDFFLNNDQRPLGAKGNIPTSEEWKFAIMFPDLEKQVSFGSGKGGYEKYTFKNVTVDFLDRENKIAIEIDGKSHNTEFRKIKDKLKSMMLLEVHGIKTYRISNRKVNELFEGMIING